VAIHKALGSDAPFGLLATLALRARLRLFNALRASGPRFGRNDNHINPRFPKEPLVAEGNVSVNCLPPPAQGQAPVESQRDTAATARIDACIATMERRHDF
jgi:hypothetical protein